MPSRTAADPFRARGLSSETERVELALASARAFVAVCLVAASFTPVSSYSPIALASVGLSIYAAYSLILVVVVNIRDEITAVFQLIVHSVDVLLSATWISAQPESPFLPFILSFPLLTAAYRWGLLQTLTTAAAALVVGFSSVAVTNPTPDVGRLAAIAALVVLVAALLGYLADKEHQRRAEASIITRIIEKPQVEAGLTWTLRRVAHELLALVDARRGVLIARETATGRVFLWQIHRGFGRETTLRSSDLDDKQRNTYLDASSASAWHTVRRTRSWPVESPANYDVVAVDSAGKRLWDPMCPAPDGMPDWDRSDSLMAVSFEFANEWTGRLFLLDPVVGR